MSFVDACRNDLVEKLFADHWLVMIVSDLSDILFKTSASRDLHLHFFFVEVTVQGDGEFALRGLQIRRQGCVVL